MRFLLTKSINNARARAARASESATTASATTAIAEAATATDRPNRIHPNAPVSAVSAKAWGQQCSPNCGCILRFELDLSQQTHQAVSPTVVNASYHTKRVMGTFQRPTSSSSIAQIDNGEIYLKPLLTTPPSSKQTNRTNDAHDEHTAINPILTSCACPTLHNLADQVVNHLPGKTIDQLRNETNLGMVGLRSSVAFRHTVLNEVVKDLNESGKLEEAHMGRSLHKRNKIRWNTQHSADANANARNNHDSAPSNNRRRGMQLMQLMQLMHDTHPHSHCYDLVEDALLSMLHEQMPLPRQIHQNDNYLARMESYSPTMGGYFDLYHSAPRPTHQPRNGRNKRDDETVMSPSPNDNGSNNNDNNDDIDWRRKSPSSYHLFGAKGTMGNIVSATTMMSLIFENAMETIKYQVLGRKEEEGLERKVGKISNVAMRKRLDAISADVHAELEGWDEREEREEREEQSRPSTTYLQLLDMYGIDSKVEEKKEEEEPLDDWLMYVDRNQSWEGKTSGSG